MITAGNTFGCQPSLISFWNNKIVIPHVRVVKLTRDSKVIDVRTSVRRNYLHLNNTVIDARVFLKRVTLILD